MEIPGSYGRPPDFFPKAVVLSGERHGFVLKLPRSLVERGGWCRTWVHVVTLRTPVQVGRVTTGTVPGTRSRPTDP